MDTHQTLKRLLNKAIKKGRLAHAFLFTGQEGAGKRQLALDLGAGLLCEENKIPPCQSCAPCRRTSTGSHPDYHVIEPKTKKILIDQIRDLIDNLHLHSYEGGRRVAVIPDAEKMTIDAQNAFLKTLEEPPADTVLVLTSSNPSGLLPTILSRCQVLRVRPLGESAIKDLVMKERGLSEGDAGLIAALCAGDAKKAMEMDEKLVSRDRRELIEKLLSLDSEDPSCFVDFAEELDKSAYPAETLFDILAGFYIDALYVKIGKSVARNRDLDELVRREARRSNIGSLWLKVEEIQEAILRVKRNANPRLTWEILAMSLRDVAGARLTLP